MKNPFTIILKALQSMQHPRGQVGWSLKMPRTGFNYAAEVGDGTQNSIIMACLRWVRRTYPEAPLVLRTLDSEGDWEDCPRHPMLDLLDMPNPHYDGLLMQSALITELLLDGNAYLLKVRSAAGRVVQLWWAPGSLMEPKWPQDGSVYLSHYDYKPGGMPIRVEVADVVHFRDGLDPRNTRKGLSPLRSLLRELFTDDEAANFTASLLRNLGVPGVVISPKDGGAYAGDLRETKKALTERFTGDRRGEPIVMGGPTDIAVFGFNPQQMLLRDLRRVPEERVSAVLGVPAVVAGLGAGLDRSTYANFAEAREAAYESGIIPLQRLVASALKRQLLPDFEQDISEFDVAYDLSNIRILQEDENTKAVRLNSLVSGGILTVGEARRDMGWPTDESHDLYLRPLGLIEVPVGSAPRAMMLPEGEPEPEMRALERKALTSAQKRLMLLLRRDRERLEAAAAKRLGEVFAGLGQRAARALENKAHTNGVEVKDGPADQARRAARAILMLDVDAFVSKTLSPVILAHYLAAAQRVYESVNTALGGEARLDDRTTKRILEAGGRRVGLLDVTGQTRGALMQALADGEAAGESTRELAARVAQYVEKGRYQTVRIRSELIARTETNYAMNLSSLEAYQASPAVRGYMLLDAQLGETDAECMDRNGRIVTPQEAEDALEQEHPLGTLSIVPLT